MQESAFRVTRGTDHGASAQGIRGWGRRSRHSVTAGELHDPQLHACASDPAGSLTCTSHGSRPGVDGLLRDVALGGVRGCGISLRSLPHVGWVGPRSSWRFLSGATRLFTGERGMTLHSTHRDWLARHVPSRSCLGHHLVAVRAAFSIFLCLGPRVSGRTPARPSLSRIRREVGHFCRLTVTS